MGMSIPYEFPGVRDRSRVQPTPVIATRELIAEGDSDREDAALQASISHDGVSIPLINARYNRGARNRQELLLGANPPRFGGSTPLLCSTSSARALESGLSYELRCVFRSSAGCWPKLAAAGTGSGSKMHPPCSPAVKTEISQAPWPVRCWN
jgi:hypothetical protein